MSKLTFLSFMPSAKHDAAFSELPEDFEASCVGADIRPILDAIVQHIPDARGDDQAPLVAIGL